MKKKSEEKCREIMERLLNTKLPSSHPSWLRNPQTGKVLELDGYNSDFITQIGYGLAFEYDGQQHKKFNAFMHKTESNFKKQLIRDDAKNQICLSKGVLLVRIPHFENRTDESMERDIKKILKKQNLLLF